MISYHEWQNEKPASTPSTTGGTPMQAGKKWKASKEQVMQFWQSLQPNIPLAIQPIPYEHSGSTYQQDGIRVTGSKEFIASTIARLKDFMQYENPKTKLMVVYRQTDKQAAAEDGQRMTYVFYIQAKDRGSGTPTIKPPKPELPKLPKLPKIG